MDRTFFLIGSLSGGTAVLLGAFGAHALRESVPTESLATFETAVRYQMYHALALIGVAFALSRWPDSALAMVAGWLFVAGTLIFSGSLYLLVVSGARWLGALTPLGGVALIAGWLCLAFTAWRG